MAERARSLPSAGRRGSKRGRSSSSSAVANCVVGSGAMGGGALDLFALGLSALHLALDLFANSAPASARHVGTGGGGGRVGGGGDIMTPKSASAHGEKSSAASAASLAPSQRQIFLRAASTSGFTFAPSWCAMTYRGPVVIEWSTSMSVDQYVYSS
eukprot:CAMPEP_0119401176 /NCGR_PEP_ID=MMETSP1334-20130426/142241_1 /TAXON_ID=127549 /ORGANISM="Calcidiscus leptoporus, Strain RCC1130" /LENGTH=155 /DNA_ID=CAMNT_0007425091 /DNA_START=528 /DNA_END=995 /DNA_ORIENTATION=+